MAGIVDLPKVMRKAEMAGRRGDTEMAHVSPGEIVLPKQLQTPGILSAILRAMMERGVDPAEFVVGSAKNKINPSTGQPEFFLGGLVGGLFGSSKRESTQTSELKLPEYLEEPVKRLIARAEETAEQPFAPFEGQRYADLTPAQLEAIQLMQDNLGVGAGELEQAAEMAREIGRAPTAEEVAQYESPYTQEVLDTVMADLEREFAEQEVAARKAAGITGALGGSREGVRRSESLENYLRTRAATQAQLRSAAFDRAMSARQAGLQTGIGALASIGPARGALQAGQTQDVLRAGTLEQAQEQQQLDFDYGEFLREQEYPFQTEQFLAGILSGVPTSKTTVGTLVQPGPPPFQQLAGLGLAAASIYSGNPAAFGNLFGATGGGGGGGGLGLWQGAYNPMNAGYL